ncbi:hypothetical protein [Gordonia sp. (in: high G+C Gram-positive bacteria)]|uniref:hypothetical protein n=1 Tax=Gordonia sp. (in: high G+C Gram-positive bacteria) TaxID=84139 RepID=UPI003C716773
MSTTTAPRELRDAGIHVAVTIGLGILAVIGATFTTGTADTVFVIASAVLVILGTIAAMVRTYLNYKHDGRWQIWQGATWLLLGLSLLWFTAALPIVIVGK